MRLLCACAFARAGADIALYAYLPLYLHSAMGETRLWLIGLALAMPALCRSLTGPLWGRWADARGRQRPLIVGGLLAYSATLGIVPHLATTESVVWTLAALGPVFSAFSPVSRAWITLSAKRDGVRRLARWHQWEGVGYLVWSAALGWAGGDIGAFAFGMSGLAVVLGICALIAARLDNQPVTVAPGRGRAGPTLARNRRRWDRLGRLPLLGAPIRAALSALPASVLAFVFWSSIGWESVSAMFSLYFTSALGGSPLMYGLTLSASTGIASAAYPALAWYARRRSERHLLRLAAWGYPAMYALMALRSPLAAGVAYLIPMSAVVRTAVNVHVAERVPDQRKARTIGWVDAMEASSTMGGALLGGVLADRLGLAALPLSALVASLLLHGLVPRSARR